MKQVGGVYVESFGPLFLRIVSRLRYDGVTGSLKGSFNAKDCYKEVLYLFNIISAPAFEFLYTRVRQ